MARKMHMGRDGRRPAGRCYYQHRARRLKMTRPNLIAAAALAWLALSPQQVSADYFGAPWCAVVAAGDGDMQWHCEYQSIEECRPNVLAGNRGWCNQNPYPVAAYSATESWRTRNHRTRTQ